MKIQKTPKTGKTKKYLNNSGFLILSSWFRKVETFWAFVHFDPIFVICPGLSRTRLTFKRTTLKSSVFFFLLAFPTWIHVLSGFLFQVSSVKVIRNKQTSQSEGYGFVEFLSRSAAEEVLQSYSGVTMPNAEQPFRLNWASFSTGEKRASENGGPDLSIFVGDLAPDVTDATLLETFAGYQSVKGAKVVIDSNTGRSKGYGFVRFGDESERSRALTEMNGAFCSSRQMRVGIATPKRAAAYGQQNGSQGK